MTTMADGHEADRASLAVDGIDDTKAANAKLPQPVEFPEQRVTTLGISGNGANRRLNRALQVWMERADHLGNMRRDVGAKGLHAVRRFFTGVTGSPKTSSKESPFLPAL